MKVRVVTLVLLGVNLFVKVGLCSTGAYTTSQKFTPYDFLIIENYIHLNVAPKELIRMKKSEKSISFKDDHLGVTFQEIVNSDGWRAIRIASHTDKSIEYFLNYETDSKIKEEDANPENFVTILTTSCGDPCEQVAMQHFLDMLYALKKHLLVKHYTNLLIQFLQSHDKSTGEIVISKEHRFQYEIRWINSKERHITITPNEFLISDPAFHNFKSYTISEKIKKKRSIVSWWYESEGEEIDDYFFTHFSQLLIEAKSNRI